MDCSGGNRLSKPKSLLIAIDIGNTSTTCGVFLKTRLISKSYCESNDIPYIYSKIRNKWDDDVVFKAILSSVVPKISVKLINLIRHKFQEDKVHEVGRNVNFKLKMKYAPRQLGADRLVNAYGAKHFYCLPCLVIDFGTATTFDLVSHSGVFEGGLIIPGIQVSAKGLEAHAALLPLFEMNRSVRTLIGRNTKQAMTSGLLNGFGAMTDGLIERFKELYGKQLTVVATGGFARKIAAYAHLIQTVDELHTIKSLAHLYQNEIAK